MPFQFKQFSVIQQKSAMKVGTDGVLLGAWANTNATTTVLDIGTGTGLIALMLAQRNSTALIDAIEINQEAYSEAQLNFLNSPWSNRLTAIHTSLQNFTTNKTYQLIVCNPPFFNNSTKAPSNNRNTARHTDTLIFSDLVITTKKLLAANGKFALILPTTESQLFIETAQKEKLFLNRKCILKPNPTKNSKRVLMEFSFSETPIAIENLTIETEKRHQYTKEYIALTKAFYVNF